MSGNLEENTTAVEEQEVSPLTFTPTLSNTQKPPMIEKSLLSEGELITYNQSDIDAYPQYRIVDKEVEIYSDEFENFYRTFVTTRKIEEDIKLTTKEKDELFDDAISKCQKLERYLIDTDYKLHLTQDECKTLSDILNHHVSYNIDTIHIGIMLKSKIDKIIEFGNKNDRDAIYTIEISMFLLSYMVQLLKTYEWKGLGSKAIRIYNILMKISAIDDVHKYFKTQYEVNNNNLMEFFTKISNDLSPNN